MLNTYYQIWVDAINFEKNKKGRDYSWQAFTMISISILQGLNLLALLFLIRALTHNEMPIIIPLDIFHIKSFNTFISLAITFFLPFVILNYLLIFYNDRYQELLKSYPDKNGKWYRNYFIVSAAIIVIPVIFKLIF